MALEHYENEEQGFFGSFWFQNVDQRYTQRYKQRFTRLTELTFQKMQRYTL
jgi:hypothetical protein